MPRMTDTELAEYGLRRKKVEAAREEPAIKPKRKALKLTRPEPTESAVLSMIMRALKVHPKVAHFWRQNTGAMAIGEGKARRFVRFGAKGQPDIQGYLTGTGRAMYIEVKKPSGKVAPEQQEFIDLANKHGALAFVARSVSDVFNVLDEL